VFDACSNNCAGHKHILIIANYCIYDRSGWMVPIAINSGILTELYNYGITKEQLSNLKALADYMGAKYYKPHGKLVLEISDEQLKAYFGENNEQ
jgi:hypothetical protein